VRSDLSQSWIWYETQRAQCTPGSDFLHPQMYFIDFTLVDKYGKVNVEPFTFSGGRGQM
jgi:hypothetical protein